MNEIKPLSETQETVTLSRADFEALLDDLEDAEDRVSVLEDCMNDVKPPQQDQLLTNGETMRLIDGESPIKIWREKRGMTLTQLAVALGLHDVDLAAMENGGPLPPGMPDKLGRCLGTVLPDWAPVKALP